MLFWRIDHPATPSADRFLTGAALILHRFVTGESVAFDCE